MKSKYRSTVATFVLTNLKINKLDLSFIKAEVKHGLLISPELTYHW